MHKRICYLFFFLALCLPMSAQEIEIPDPNLREAIHETLDLPLAQTITRTDIQSLTNLEAKNRDIEVLIGLEAAAELNHLVLSENRIKDITPLANLVKLQHLALGGNRISQIDALANLTNLTTLHLSSNDIIDVSPLSRLTHLKRLYLSVNRIVNVQPLSGLESLRELEIAANNIVDHTPLDNLGLINYLWDQTCDSAPLPLEPRLQNRTYPSIFAPFSSTENQDHIPWAPRMAQHNLHFSGTIFGTKHFYTGDGWEIRRAMPDGRDPFNLHRAYLSHNPNMIFLAEIRMRDEGGGLPPPDWPSWVWVEDAQGNPAVHGVRRLINFTHPLVQDMIVSQALAIARCGLYDGIFFDWWKDTGPVLANREVGWGEGYYGNEAEQRARDNIITRIRAQTRPDFLVIGNTNDRIIPRTGKYLNGGYMESIVPTTDASLTRVRHSLHWLENNLRTPRLNLLQGGSNIDEPPDSPENLRLMRAFTTLSLTHSNGYVHFGIGSSSRHYWYDFWDADLGQPVGEKAQKYQEIDGLYIREFTNGWAVYNHSGAEQTITLPELTSGVASGLEGLEHTLPNLDGEMYLKRRTEVNGNDIFIAEPINAVSGAVLLLDASNNPGTTAPWVNQGTAGGTLLFSEWQPRVEEGEIEIPSIGFRGRRRYYTLAATRQIFGGPVDKNPPLYLGDWTLEFLCKRNGNLFHREHQFAGFQNSPREGLQGIRLRLPNDGRELELSIHADNSKQPTRTLNTFLEENVWTWVTIVSINDESIIAYQDGVEVSRHPGVHFDATLPIDDISIGANSYDERRRNFNGSFSIVRVYDRALSPDEVLQNIGAAAIPDINPADVNRDGVVNILDLVVVAQGLGTENPEADVNRDGVVNVFDLVQVAGAIGDDGAAPSASSLDLSNISVADVAKWLAQVRGLNIGDSTFQRGIRFLEQLLAALTPEKTTLLPNYPNPFNPETWIPYHLAQEVEVAITIYDTKGTLVRRLALGNQSAGHYAERGKAAYWDGRNERGEAVASGIYIYQFRAGDYAASRRMVIVK